MGFSRVYAEVARILLERGFLSEDELQELFDMYGDDARDAIDALIASGAVRYTERGVEAVDRQRLARVARSFR